MMEEQGVCFGCPNEFGDKRKCLNTCKRREAYAAGREYFRIDYPYSSSIDEDDEDTIEDIAENTIKDQIKDPLQDNFVVEAQEEAQVVRKVYPKIKKKPCLVCKTKILRAKRGLCSKCYQLWYRGSIEHPILGAFKFSKKLIEENIMPEPKKEENIMPEPKKEENIMPEPKKRGKKDSAGKLDWSFMPMQTLEGVARVFEKGAIPEKYNGRFTWLPGIKYSKMHSAIIRHLFAWFYKGVNIDPESGEHPLSHVIANAMILLSFCNNGKNFDDDDRVL